MLEPLHEVALDALREGFAVFDGDGLTLTQANKRFRELLQLPEDLSGLGTPLDAIVRHRAERGDYGPGDPASHHATWMARAREPAADEHRLDHGTLLERFVPIPGRGLVLTVADNRRVHEAETKIARMAKFPDENPNPVLRFDPEDRLSYANPSSRDLCQRAACVQPGDAAPAQWQECFVRARDTGRPVPLEYAQAGAVYSMLFAPVSDTSEINAYAFDITERIQHQRELAQARDAADRANLTKSQFLANMSHELRTPMNAILGFTKLVMRRSKDVLPEKQYNNLGKVRVSGEHLLALINNILDLSKIEAGRMEVNPAWFDLRRLVDLCVKTVEPLIKPGVELRSEIGPEVGEVYGDEVKVKQILINLLSNAAKFTVEGSVTLAVALDGDQVVASVRDTGIGIAEDKLEKVFEEFSQADGSTTREYGGTGLGLTICRRLADLMGGDIAVESAVGEGSTFSVRFPARHGDAPERPATDTQAAPAPTRPEKRRVTDRLVLSIDDDRNVVDLVRQNLADAGYRVVGAYSGADGLKKARLLEPHVILLDVIMGSNDGWQVLHSLKTDTRTKNIPVIMMSIIEEHSLAFRLGASGYLSKPVSRESLLQSVENVCGKGARVLVVDDNPDVIELLSQILSEEGHTMIAARNGEEGLARIADSNPDIMVLDLMMPVLDGFGLLERLRDLGGHDDLPIVILTAKVLSGDEEQELRRRVHNIVTKGGKVRQSLVQQIEAIVGASRAGGKA